MTEHEQCEISMSKSGCAELMVTVCIRTTYIYGPVRAASSRQQRLASDCSLSISISFCSFVMHVCPNLSMRMAACFKRRKKERRKERKKERKKEIERKKEKKAELKKAGKKEEEKRKQTEKRKTLKKKEERRKESREKKAEPKKVGKKEEENRKQAEKRKH